MPSLNSIKEGESVVIACPTKEKPKRVISAGGRTGGRTGRDDRGQEMAGTSCPPKSRATRSTHQPGVTDATHDARWRSKFRKAKQAKKATSRRIAFLVSSLCMHSIKQRNE